MPCAARLIYWVHVCVPCASRLRHRARLRPLSGACAAHYWLVEVAEPYLLMSPNSLIEAANWALFLNLNRGLRAVRTSIILDAGELAGCRLAAEERRSVGVVAGGSTTTVTRSRSTCSTPSLAFPLPCVRAVRAVQRCKSCES